MSLAHCSIWGNKIRKLWKLLAKNDMFTFTASSFSSPQNCKVKFCKYKVVSIITSSSPFSYFFQSNTAVETFRHIRENHLKQIKMLRIKFNHNM